MTTPTEPGWYWWRDEPEEPWRATNVVRHGRGLIAFVDGNEEDFSLQELGPIWGPRIPDPDTLREVVEVLRRVKSYDTTGAAVCPMCWLPGHAPDCRLAAVLKKLEER